MHGWRWILLLPALLVLDAPTPPPARTGGGVAQFVSAKADSLEDALARLASARGTARRTEFRIARRYYKHLEPVVEFYAPALAALFNSRRQEVDDDDAPPPAMLGARGFPALEDQIGDPKVSSDSVRRTVAEMRIAVGRVRSLAKGIVLTDAQLIELSRQELTRVSTLGIAGFDTPRTHDAMTEGADAIQGLRLLFRAMKPNASLDASFSAAVRELRGNPDFATFNRLRYIAGAGNRAAIALETARREWAVIPVTMPRALRVDAASPYMRDAFDALAYAPRGAARDIDDGRRLFFDPSLSGTGTRSCASCHQASRSFSDGRSTPTSLVANEPVRRNTPTLLNAALQPSQFSDGRAVTLEDQALLVLASPTEMGSSVDRVAKLKGMTPLHVRQAIAAYVRSLVSLDSRFDRAVRGDTLQLSPEERSGFTLFMGKAACGTCHFAPLFNGTVPPRYVGSDVEVIGTPADPRKPRILDSDSGRARIDHLPAHVRAFKVPTLRNVTRTAPYMHNGAFRTLEEVIDFYDAGGGRGAGAPIANQTLPSDSLHLTRAEKQAIIAFLGSLADR